MTKILLFVDLFTAMFCIFAFLGAATVGRPGWATFYAVAAVVSFALAQGKLRRIVAEAGNRP